MDYREEPVASGYENDTFSNKNILITVLVVLLVFSFLGINLLSFGGEIIQSISNFFQPFFNYVAGLLGYTAGTLIDDTADVAANVAKGGIDIADGVAHSIGDLLKGNATAPPDLAKTVNTAPAPKYKQPSPDTTANPIQQPIAAAKQTWCLV